MLGKQILRQEPGTLVEILTTTFGDDREAERDQLLAVWSRSKIVDVHLRGSSDVGRLIFGYSFDLDWRLRWTVSRHAGHCQSFAQWNQILVLRTREEAQLFETSMPQCCVVHSDAPSTVLARLLTEDPLLVPRSFLVHVTPDNYRDPHLVDLLRGLAGGVEHEKHPLHGLSGRRSPRTRWPVAILLHKDVHYISVELSRVLAVPRSPFLWLYLRSSFPSPKRLF